MKILCKYGKMFSELSEQIQTDIKTKTDKDLKLLELEARSAGETNCSWADYRIARTVLEYVCDEQRDRVKQVQ